MLTRDSEPANPLLPPTCGFEGCWKAQTFYPFVWPVKENGDVRDNVQEGLGLLAALAYVVRLGEWMRGQGGLLVELKELGSFQ